MKRYKSGGTNGIPSFQGGEPNTAAASVITNFDVEEGRDYVLSVKPGIEETKRVQALRNTEVIKQRDYARHCLDIDGQLDA